MRTRSIGRPSRRIRRLLLLAPVLIAAAGRPSGAQVAPSGFFTDPVLIPGGGGHQAPVRSMLFTTRDGSQLLTGGMDKVIHVWDLNVDRTGPARTLRPPNWRGARGQVNALALSPVVDGDNQRLLAVAGYGVLADMGEILLFRYPGPNGQGTGDVVGQLSAAPALLGQPERLGHTGVVTSLAFTPDGQFLASASNDRTVRIWDLAALRQVAVMAESPSPVNTLAVFANGTRLVAGGADGFLRLYDITNRAAPALMNQAPPVLRDPNDPVAPSILTVAASPDNRWIVAGTEAGFLLRYDAANLAAGGMKLPVEWTGPVEALAISPDGQFLATSIIAKNLATATEFPTTACRIELRSMPDGTVRQRLQETTNLVQAFAFSPDSLRLAYSGGDTQAVFIKDLGQGAPAEPDEIRGPGSSVWDVGFRLDGNAVRFARSHPAAPGQGGDYEYFDLRGRHFFNPEPGEPAYRHAVASEAGWTIRPVDQYQFDFRNAQNQGWRRSLDPTNERRWFAYTVIPPGPGHADPVAAVAAEMGVVLWNMRTGEKTRFFNGHSGSVYAIASSPDGRWLVTGSRDQTVRIWPLAGCDRVPAFGARFERNRNGAWVVAEVTPGGFAEGVPLKKDDVIEELYVSDYGPAKKVDNPAGLLPFLDQQSPTKFFSFFYSRLPAGSPQLRAGSSKRDSPALSLFPGVDRRWVLWTPRGYYDSSADGDRKFLGWLNNRGSPRQLLAATYDSIDKFEARYRQLKVPGNGLDRLLDTGDPLRAVPQAPAVAAPDPSTSKVEVLALAPAGAGARAPGPVPVATPQIQLDYRAVASAGASLIREVWVEVNGRRLPANINPFAAPAANVQGQIAVPMGDERDVRVSLEVVGTDGVHRSQSIDLRNQAPPPPDARKSRLEVVSIGADHFLDKRFPDIRHAEADARDVSRFLADHLVDPATGNKFARDQVRPRPFLNGQVAKSGILAAFDEIRAEALAGRLGPGDVVAVVVESHFLDFHSQRLLATSEPDGGQPEPPSFSASELADRLGELTRLGVRAVVLVDAVHDVKKAPWDVDIREWVRQLQTQSRALVFMASDHGPSSPNGDGHRVFAQGILDALKAGNNGRLWKPGAPMSLFDFQRTVSDFVLQKTVRKQHAQCYLPDTLSYPLPFLDSSPVPR